MGAIRTKRVSGREGSRSELALALDGIGESDYVLALSLGSICVGPDASLRVEALVNGERVAVREFSYGDPEWRIELPAPVPADGEVDLAFEIEEPESPLELGWSATTTGASASSSAR